MTVIRIFVILTTLYSLQSCNNDTVSPVASNSGDVKLVCLRQADTFHLKIFNGSEKIIYIPKTYDGDYTNNDDTLHFEAHHKSKYNSTSYYLYKTVFPFEFYTNRAIPGLTADSIDKVVQQTNLFNQFRVKPFVKVLPDSSIVVKSVYNAAKYATIIKVVYYPEEFLDKQRIEKVQYNFEDFQKYDSLKARYISAPMYVIYE